jgi:hypothetical protein
MLVTKIYGVYNERVILCLIMLKRSNISAFLRIKNGIGWSIGFGIDSFWIYSSSGIKN